MLNYRNKIERDVIGEFFNYSKSFFLHSVDDDVLRDASLDCSSSLIHFHYPDDYVCCTISDILKNNFASVEIRAYIPNLKIISHPLI